MSPISAGTGYEYLTREVASTDDYYLRGVEQGEAPGRWIGQGCALLELTGRVEAAQMEALYGTGTDWRNGQQLGRRFAIYRTFDERIADALAAEPDASPDRKQAIIEQVRRADPEMFKRVEKALARAERIEGELPAERRMEIEMRVRAKAERGAQAGYDFTWTPPKSFSLFIAGLGEADRERAIGVLQVANDAMVSELERLAGKTREGAQGVRQVDVERGFIVASFMHRTNREGEPNWHFHNAILNKVKSSNSGKWLTADSMSLAKHRHAAGKLADKLVAAEMEREFGVRTIDRGDGVYEIAGLDDPTLRGLFSTRALQVEARRDELFAEYRETYGYEPTGRIRAALLDRAKKETRKAKGGQELAADAVGRWRTVARSNGYELTSLADRARGNTSLYTPDQLAELDQAWADLAGQATSTVADDRNTWTLPNVLSVVRELAPVDRRFTPDEYAERTVTIAQQVLDAGVRLSPEAITAPAQLRRRDGQSVYERAGEQVYTDAAVVAREQWALTYAASTSTVRFDPARVHTILQAPNAHGHAATPDQFVAARHVLLEQRSVSVLIGPAGTGKTFVQESIARAALDQGVPVVGLTLGSNAAQVLADEIDNDQVRTYNIAQAIEAGRHGHSRFPQGGLVIVDEAGMVPDAELAWVLAQAEQHGCKTLLVGDHHQLSAPGAGGLTRLLASAGGYAELAEVRRFRHLWERAASLGLRTGDHAVLGAYLVHDRIREGDHDDVRSSAIADWHAARRTGKTALIMAATNEMAASLAGECRARLVATGTVMPDGVGLHDGNIAGEGDEIMTRLNHAELRDSTGAPVTNRAVWRVAATKADGSLHVVHCDNNGRPNPNRTVTLPASYVAEHVELAYASTVHAAQGRTLDRGIAYIGTGAGWNRASLYVAMTRGRDDNSAYVETVRLTHDEDQARTTRDPIEILGGILDTDDQNLTAHEVREALLEQATSMAHLGWVYADAVAVEIEARIVSTIDTLQPGQGHRVRHSPGWPDLIAACRNVELDGHQLAPILTAAVSDRELATAVDPAAALNWRIEDRALRGVFDAPTDVPVVSPMPDPELVDFIDRVEAAIVHRTAVLADRARTERPAWMATTSDDMIGHVAGYRELIGLADDEPLGREPGARTPDHFRWWQTAVSATIAPDPEVVMDAQDIWRAALADVNATHPDRSAELRELLTKFRPAKQAWEDAETQLKRLELHQPNRRERSAHEAATASYLADVVQPHRNYISHLRAAIDQLEAGAAERSAALRAIAHLKPTQPVPDHALAEEMAVERDRGPSR